ncbi:MAG TPA: hypothetical protein VFA09_22120 [Ktedonobacteraceae bacterium]|nr:hypothetical protein [Ktedonobacteraceae bacterium]
MPFSFNPDLELVVDPSLLENDEIYFNAARLDRSMVLKTSDYVAIAKPRLKHIIAGREAMPEAASSEVEEMNHPVKLQVHIPGHLQFDRIH